MVVPHYVVLQAGFAASPRSPTRVVVVDPCTYMAAQELIFSSLKCCTPSGRLLGWEGKYVFSVSSQPPVEDCCEGFALITARAARVVAS